jgi:hypothetical protein
MNVRGSAILFMLALVGGCQSTSSSSGEAPAQNGETRFSGFLGDYSQLRPAPDREGVLLFLDKSANYQPYTKVMFDPVQVIVTPNPDYQIPPEETARMADALLRSFKQALEPAYQVVTQPGPDVLRVRAAITGIQPAKPAAGAIDYLPFKAIYNVGREAAGAGPRVAEMAAEMEVLDPSGKRVAAATATRKGETTLPQGGQITWNDLQAIDDYWAKSFRHRLDELRGVGGQG